jgi:GH15 family glucan-1,4-alpha-glucosidase
MRYGIIGNCKSAALIHESGSVDWCCLPNFDHPSVFARLLDDRGGHFAVLPQGLKATRQSYLPNTNILETRFETSEGAFLLLDYMPRYSAGGRYHHPPEIQRRIIPLSGRPSFKVEFFPRLNYALGETLVEKSDHGIRAHFGPEDIFLYSSLSEEGILRGETFTLAKEEFLLLSYHERLKSPTVEGIRREGESTQAYWQTWSSHCRLPSVAPEAVLRSALTLKLMTFEESGAIIAAPTTSLPEALGEGRNWDYRYCWLRDSSLMLEALKGIGHFEEARAFLRFLFRILESKQSKVQIVYGIDGRTRLDEFILPHLKGYQGNGPVRVGNLAAIQKQNDIFGEVLDALYLYYLHYRFEEIGHDEWALVKFLTDTTAREWASEDAGIWEYRQRTAHFTFSKLLSWAGLDRGAKFASALGKSSKAAAWSEQAAAVRKNIEAEGWNPRIQAYTQTYGSSDLDVSILKMQPLGFVEENDPRWVSTVRRCAEGLLKGDYGYRYTAPDDFGKPKSSFILATFWIAKALFSIGERERAFELFEKTLARSNHLGLLSEDIDPLNGNLLGNFPQAFSHMALINTANLLAKA